MLRNARIWHRPFERRNIHGGADDGSSLAISLPRFAMMSDNLDHLTDRERECLRLVYRGYESKEIAPQLGISPDRVNKLVKGAMRKLGVTRRATAARMLAEYESGTAAPEVTHSVGAPSLGVATTALTSSDGTIDLQERDRQRAHDKGPSTGVLFRAWAPPEAITAALPLRTDGRRQNDLGSRSTMVAIAIIACAAAATAGVGAALLLILNWLITSR